MPDYLSSILHKHETSRPGLRSADGDCNLVIPICSKKTHAERSFSVAGPKWWNELPISLKKCDTGENFKKMLKTYLFTEF